jgi:hypothetical protein
MTSGCPACGAEASGAGHFCEQCGADLRSSGRTWQLTATADRTFFGLVDAGDVDFPVDGFERSFDLRDERAMIGRRSTSRGIYPDIDLSGPPTDTGISHVHAVLVRQSGGTWAVVDPGSTNGIYLNDRSDAIPRDELVPVAEGDRIHIGAWTTLTLLATTHPRKTDCTEAEDQPGPPSP